MALWKAAGFLVIASCGTNAPTQERHDLPARRATFVCEKDFFESERCYASSAEDLAGWNLKDAKLADRAWCVASPARPDANGRLCYLTLPDCMRRANMDPLSEGPCMAQSAAAGLLAVYGGSDAR